MPSIPAVRYAVLIGLLIGIIFVSSSVPNLRFWPSVEVDLAIRKILHVVVYFSLAFLIAVFASRRLPRLAAGALAVFVVVLIALGDEVNQSTVVGREASLLDVAIDIAAAVLAALVFIGISLIAVRRPADRS